MNYMNKTIIIFFIALICIIVLPIIIRLIKENKRLKEINFDEFDDIDKIKQQEEKEKQEMKYEYKVLKKVYNDSFQDRNGNGIKEITISDMIKAQKNVKEAKEQLYNFKMLDSVEVDNENVPEGISIDALRENGNNFDINLFKKWSRQIFGCIKMGTEEQLNIVKNFMTEELYDRLMHQIKQFEKDDLEFITEDLLIEELNLLDYGKGMAKEEIKILVKAKMKEYIVQKSTDKVIRGNKNKFYEKKIVMTFLKQNSENKEGLLKNCPNCGAEVSQTELGKCRYCATLIFPIRYNWTLIKFETM